MGGFVERHSHRLAALEAAVESDILNHGGEWSDRAQSYCTSAGALLRAGWMSQSPRRWAQVALVARAYKAGILPSVRTITRCAREVSQRMFLLWLEPDGDTDSVAERLELLELADRWLSCAHAMQVACEVEAELPVQRVLQDLARRIHRPLPEGESRSLLRSEIARRAEERGAGDPVGWALWVPAMDSSMAGRTLKRLAASEEGV